LGVIATAAEDAHPPAKKKAGFCSDAGAGIGGVGGPPSAQPIAKPVIPPTPALVPKSAKGKIAILAEAIADAWMRVPDVGVPVKGPGSCSFGISSLLGAADVGPGTAAARQVASASFGWKASAAGPERIFSTASLWHTALKNNYSVVMLEFMVFLKKNKAFMPSPEEVVTELKRL